MSEPFAREFVGTPTVAAPARHIGRGAPKRRILCIATHHKTGTMWLRTTFRSVAEEQDIPFMQLGSEAQLAQLPDTGPQICVNWSASFPPALLEREDVFTLHAIRDPRDVLVSGMRYHRIAPTARERFLLEQRPEWNGLTYQEHLNALPTDVERLLFEMDNKHAQTLEDMLRWEYGRPNAAELRYEEMIADVACLGFRRALENASLVGLDVEAAVASFWENALFGGQRDPEQRHPRTALHIQSGAAAQWKTRLPREVAEAYARRFGAALRALGYAEDDSWVAGCAPAKDLAPEQAAG